MNVTFLRWGAGSLALLVSAAGVTTVLAQDQPASQSSPAAAAPAQQPETTQGAKLEKQQRTIHKQVAAGRKANGGTLTASEKKQINREQNQASRNIYRKKHNAATQPEAKPKQ